MEYCADGLALKKATKEDARLMLQLEELLLMEPNQRAFHWFWRVFYPQKLKSRDDVRRVIPANSEGQRYFDRIAEFWESAGTLVKNGLLNEQLFFDRFLLKPYWEALGPVIIADRDDANEPRISENFEWLAMREPSLRTTSKKKG